MPHEHLLPAPEWNALGSRRFPVGNPRSGHCTVCFVGSFYPAPAPRSTAKPENDPLAAGAPRGIRCAGGGPVGAVSREGEEREMDLQQYEDEFGFRGPLPTSSNQRRLPEPGFSPGPEVGERLLDFSLTDHTGRRTTLHADRGDEKAAVVFFRSIVWSPACLTQLGEFQDALPDFRAAGVRLYGLSYDDREALAEFARVRRIGFPLLSDPSSAVIWRFGLLNTLLALSDVPFYGVAYPGTFLLDEAGLVAAKFFQRHMSIRVSAETVLDTATGRIALGEEEPRAVGGGDGVRVTAFLRGGRGVVKMGALRRLVVHLELEQGLSLCAPPAPAGVQALEIEVTGPPGLHVEAPVLPPATPRPVPGRDGQLSSWSGSVDLVVPVWASSDLICIMTAPKRESAKLELTLRYQLCDAGGLRPPRSERLTLEVPIGAHDVPNLPEIGATGHKLIAMESVRHFQRMIRRATPELDGDSD